MKKKIFGIWVIILIMIFTATACSAKKDSDSSDRANVVQSDTADGGNTTVGSGMKYDNLTVDSGTKANTGKESNSEELSNSSAISTNSLQANSNDKIIKRFNLEVETKDFDNLIKKLNNQTKELGGYIESSQISGQSYNDSNVLRNGDIVARIPSKKTDEFVNTVSDNANVTNNSCTTENVTLDYVDAQSRMEALKIEQKRLFDILDKTKDLKSIITLESRLSDIRYEIQNYESQLRIYDNDVDYSTVTLKIQEVDRITTVNEKKPSFTERIKNGFSDSIYNIGEGFKNFLVWFIVNLPYLLIWGAIIFVAVIITRKFIRKSDKKRIDAISRFSSDQSNQNQQDQSSQNKNLQDHQQNSK